MGELAIATVATVRHQIDLGKTGRVHLPAIGAERNVVLEQRAGPGAPLAGAEAVIPLDCAAINPPMSLARLGWLCLVAVTVSALPCSAQSTFDTSLKRTLFDPSAPDARGMALAGTGIGMPDDATAVITNPAALRLLVRTEIVASAGSRFLDLDLLQGELPQVASPDDVPFTSFRDSHYEVAGAFAYPGRRFGGGGFYRVRGGSYWFTSQTWFQYGGSIAWSIRQDLSVGATLNIDQLTTSGASHGEQLKPALHVGVSYSPSSRIHVGAVHRRGVVHESAAQIYDPAAIDVPYREYSLNLPDVTGAGVGVRVTDRTRILTDVSRTRYSQLESSFAAELLPSGDADVAVADSTELRVAIEQAIALGNKALLLRGGVWREHAHPLTYLGADPFWRAVFPPDDKPRVHLTAGIGFSGEYFGVSVGADLARDFTRMLATAAVRFR